VKKQSVTKHPFDVVQPRELLSRAVTSMLLTVGPSSMNWEKIAEEISSSALCREVTAWDCIVAYYAKLKSPIVQLQTTSSVWTKEEDELLFKFLAATGPQAVVDSKNLLIQSTICAQILPRKSKRQIFYRSNLSLLNPNMQRNDWSDYEERRLPICMKVYHSVHPQDLYQMYCASTHCHGRSTKSVVDKWNRSINPAYSTKPFTTEEDEALLRVMRSVLENNTGTEAGDTQVQLQHIGWVQLSQGYFPQRHPQRLQSRWSELATDQDIINLERARLCVAKAGDRNATEETSYRHYQL
jgi:hypothetical protein